MVRRQRFGAGAYFILFHIPIYSLFSMSQLKLQVEFPNRDPKDTLDFQFSNTWNSQMSRSSQIQNTTVPQLCLLLCLIFFIIPYLTAFSFSYRQNMSKLLETPEICRITRCAALPWLLGSLQQLLSRRLLSGFRCWDMGFQHRESP